MVIVKVYENKKKAEEDLIKYDARNIKNLEKIFEDIEKYEGGVENQFLDEEEFMEHLKNKFNLNFYVELMVEEGSNKKYVSEINGDRCSYDTIENLVDGLNLESIEDNFKLIIYTTNETIRLDTKENKEDIERYLNILDFLPEDTRKETEKDLKEMMKLVLRRGLNPEEIKEFEKLYLLK